MTGSAFDQAYAQDELQGHQQAIAGFQTEISGGQNTEVIALANAGLQIIEAHNEQASILARPGEVAVIPYVLRHRDGRWQPPAVRLQVADDRPQRRPVVRRLRERRRRYGRSDRGVRR